MALLISELQEFEEKLRGFLLENFELEPEDILPFMEAFTHRSFQNGRSKINYERLELLGDSCIQLVVTSHLYSLNISLKDMCNVRKEIVQSSSLAYVAEKIGLDELLRRSRSCDKITTSMMEDLYESFIGAVFVSFDYFKTKEIIDKTLWNSFLNKELCPTPDYKTQLQELIQKTVKKDILYTLEDVVVDEEGERRFIVSLFIGGELKCSAEATKLKEAEQMAAKKLLLELS